MDNQNAGSFFEGFFNIARHGVVPQFASYLWEKNSTDRIFVNFFYLQ